jgi:hypothetical protein
MAVHSLAARPSSPVKAFSATMGSQPDRQGVSPHVPAHSVPGARAHRPGFSVAFQECRRVTRHNASVPIGGTLPRIRELIKQADPEVVEGRRWE